MNWIKKNSIKKKRKKGIPVVKEFEKVLKEVVEAKENFICRRDLVISTSNTKSLYYEGYKEHKVDFEKIIASLKSKS
jgi:hypothetical protein